jgi:hypothetical protein
MYTILPCLLVSQQNLTIFMAFVIWTTIYCYVVIWKFLRNLLCEECLCEQECVPNWWVVLSHNDLTTVVVPICSDVTMWWSTSVTSFLLWSSPILTASMMQMMFYSPQDLMDLVYISYINILITSTILRIASSVGWLLVFPTSPVIAQYTYIAVAYLKTKWIN